MKKLTAVLLALVMLLSATAFAQGSSWVDVDLGVFTVSVPEDVLGSISEEYVPDVTFATFFEDYDENKFFNRNITFSFTDELLDIHEFTPQEYAEGIAASAVQQFEAMNIHASYTTVLQADLDEQDGQEALFMMYVSLLDYSDLYPNQVVNLHTIQMIVPHEASGCTFIVTISTDNVEETETLIRIADSMKWNF